MHLGQRIRPQGVKRIVFLHPEYRLKLKETLNKTKTGLQTRLLVRLQLKKVKKQLFELISWAKKISVFLAKIKDYNTWMNQTQLRLNGKQKLLQVFIVIRSQTTYSIYINTVKRELHLNNYCLCGFKGFLFNFICVDIHT